MSFVTKKWNLRRDKEMDTLTSHYDSLDNSSRVKCWLFRRRWQRNTSEANNFSYHTLDVSLELWTPLNAQTATAFVTSIRNNWNFHPRWSSAYTRTIYLYFRLSSGYLKIYNASTASSISGATSNLRYEKALSIIKKTYRITTIASHRWERASDQNSRQSKRRKQELELVNWINKK